jgi:hypothetical protein
VSAVTRRQFLARGGALAATLVLPSSLPLPSGPPSLRKLIDIGPGGVIDPGTAQDYRVWSNRAYFAETRTGWIRMWADWPSLQPSRAFAIDDPRNPGYRSFIALDEQIHAARADGLRVMLLAYRHPSWANGSASAYRIPPEGYPLDGGWSQFFQWLLRRYAGTVDAFELVNEPNHQLQPQRGIASAVAQLMQTAQAVSARLGHPALLLAPSAADVRAVESFTGDLLDALHAVGYVPHARQAWSHHNYSDVEARSTARLDAVRARLAGRWKGSSDVWVTEGGARLEKMRKLYPHEDPLAAQATCLEAAWSSHNKAGVAMLAQYLLYADPNYDCGLLEPAPSTVKRPAYATWSSFPLRA